MASTARCPSCQAVYPISQTHCTRDGTALVNADSASAAAAEPLTRPLANPLANPLADPPADPLADPLIGQVLEDRYKIDRILGTGGMGKVYLATNLNTEKPYAIKVMHSELLHNGDAQKRFTREARAISAIAHPHIVELYDFGQTPTGLPFLVMEYLVGTSLRTYLDDTKSGLPLSQALCVAMQIARALQHVHERGIIHRDIKPDNLFITKAGQLKVLDFGIARVRKEAPSASDTATGVAIGILMNAVGLGAGALAASTLRSRAAASKEAGTVRMISCCASDSAGSSLAWA